MMRFNVENAAKLQNIRVHHDKNQFSPDINEMFNERLSGNLLPFLKGKIYLLNNMYLI